MSGDDTPPPSNAFDFAGRFELTLYGAVAARALAAGETVGVVIYWQRFVAPLFCYPSDDLAPYLRGASARDATCELREVGDDRTELVTRRSLPRGAVLSLDRLRRPWYVPLMRSGERVPESVLSRVATPLCYTVSRSSAYGSYGVRATRALAAGEHVGEVVQCHWWQVGGVCLAPFVTRPLGRCVQRSAADGNAELRWDDTTLAWHMFTTAAVPSGDELVLDSATLPCYIR